jgi:alpha-glucosidase (family GH31 glycosyl hydrolase)
MLDFNLFGVPMIGSDICGFNGDTTEELCTRWIEVGSFYPFCRNHNTIGAMSQELYRWDSVSNAAKKSLTSRYEMLPYYYTLFYYAHTNGDLVMKALWVNFPSDTFTYKLTEQFMIGTSILISPVLTPSTTVIEAYFPIGLWYNYYNMTIEIDATKHSALKELYTPMDMVNIHILGGSVLPLQQAALTTTASRQNPFRLIVALDASNKAQGSLYWDDGEQLDTSAFLFTSYRAEITVFDKCNEGQGMGRFQSTIHTNSYPEARDVLINTIVIMSVTLFQPTKVMLNNRVLASNHVQFDVNFNRLIIDNLNLPLNEEINLQWQY